MRTALCVLLLFLFIPPLYAGSLGEMWGIEGLDGTSANFDARAGKLVLNTNLGEIKFAKACIGTGVVSRGYSFSGSSRALSLTAKCGNVLGGQLTTQVNSDWSHHAASIGYTSKVADLFDLNVNATRLWPDGQFGWNANAQRKVTRVMTCSVRFARIYQARDAGLACQWAVPM